MWRSTSIINEEFLNDLSCIYILSRKYVPNHFALLLCEEGLPKRGTHHLVLSLISVGSLSCCREC